MNNADLSVETLRELQQLALDPDMSPNKMVAKLAFAIERVNKASAQITTYEQQVNRMITALYNKGMLNGDIMAAFTGLNAEQSEELSNNLEKAKKELLK